MTRHLETHRKARRSAGKADEGSLRGSLPLGPTERLQGLQGSAKLDQVLKSPEMTTVVGIRGSNVTGNVKEENVVERDARVGSGIDGNGQEGFASEQSSGASLCKLVGDFGRYVAGIDGSNDAGQAMGRPHGGNSVDLQDGHGIHLSAQLSGRYIRC